MPPGTALNQAELQAALERWERPLVRYAARITGDLETGRDAVQDTFMRLMGADPGPEAEGRAAWLFRVCRNRSIDLRRMSARLEAIDLASVRDRRASPVEAAAATERRERVQAAMAVLPAPQQEVLRLRLHHGLSYREIAEVTGRTESHVGNLLHHAVRAMRDQLAPRTSLHAGGSR